MQTTEREMDKVIKEYKKLLRTILLKSLSTTGPSELTEIWFKLDVLRGLIQKEGTLAEIADIKAYREVLIHNILILLKGQEYY